MSNSKAFFFAHRGLSGRFPENTHAAFNAAWVADCDGIELDLQVTRDGQVVVFHDPDTKRMTDYDYRISETDYKDLCNLNVGAGGKGGGAQFEEYIPLLSDVLAHVPANKYVQIEIKQQITNMDAVIAELARLREDILVQVISFDTEKLLQVRQKLPHVDCFLVMDAEAPPIDDRIGFAAQHGLKGVDMDYRLATDEMVKAAHQAGLQVGTWTVNDKGVAQQLIERGVNFLASDFADDLL